MTIFAATNRDDAVVTIAPRFCFFAQALECIFTGIPINFSAMVEAAASTAYAHFIKYESGATIGQDTKLAIIHAENSSANILLEIK